MSSKNSGLRSMGKISFLVQILLTYQINNLQTFNHEWE
ncbi:MAG: hypothetical protein ACJAVW_002316 [Spirosomataceae bacterium]|jgi:hypothetical protein